ncbi:MULTISPECIES: hypothetical protein [Entomomonas]|uniref:Uncharacterized protein n=1 Tax=Entomomonas asaccharolytica TaxID=2785331 RepID=A0A974RXM6_9GAMM|nr:MULTISPECIES: hypothetical protein [Entomomonas]QQP85024.1 hypothetical protein JHT90_11590 [Entomomonas asaccharolytica]UYZ85316.1 hypothetical protein MTZ49_07155 [Entomomonas sp. E2T0]
MRDIITIDLQKVLANKMTLLGRLWGKLKAEDAKNLTNKEIERVFYSVVLPKFCITNAKNFRDTDALYFEHGQLKYSEEKLTESFNKSIEETVNHFLISDTYSKIINNYTANIKDINIDLILSILEECVIQFSDNLKSLITSTDIRHSILSLNKPVDGFRIIDNRAKILIQKDLEEKLLK